MPSLIQEGVQIMLLGMVVVFSLLGLMVFALKGMSALAAKLSPPETIPPASGLAPTPDIDDPELIAAVTAAIQANRRGDR